MMAESRQALAGNTTHSRDTALQAAVYEGRWVSVGRLLTLGVSEASHRWAVKIAGRRLEGGTLATYILPSCHNDQLDVLLTEVVERGQWWTVGQLLKRGVGDDALRAWVVREAGERAKDEHLAAFIVPCCPPHQVDFLLTVAVKRRLWESVSLLLEQKASWTLQSWAVDEASKQADDSSYTASILCWCRGDQVEPVLKTAVSRGLWLSVSALLQWGLDYCVYAVLVNDELRTWTVNEALKHADDAHLSQIIPYCSEHQLDSLLKLAVDRQLWPCVGKLLWRRPEASLCSWAVTVCSKHATEADLVTHILPTCTDTLVQSVLSIVVKRKLWGSVATIMSRECFTEDKGKWVFVKASRNTNESSLVHRLLPICSPQHFAAVLPGLIRRGLWRALAACLRRGLTDSQRIWVAEEAICRADSYHLSVILPLCVSGHFRALYVKAVRKRRWDAVHVLLKLPCCATVNGDDPHEKSQNAEAEDSHNHSPLEDSKRTGFSQSLPCKSSHFQLSLAEKGWAVEEACKAAPESLLISKFFEHCPDSNMDAVVETVVHRRMWKALVFLLRTYSSKITEVQRGTAVETVCKNGSDSFLSLKNVVGFCPDSYLLIVLNILIRRGCWKTVADLVRFRTVSSDDLGRAIEKVSKKAKEKYVMKCLVNCPADHTEPVMRTILQRRFWRAAGLLLNQNVGDRLCVTAVELACKSAKEDVLVNNILLHCPASNAESVLEVLLKRRLWRSVGNLLSEHAISESLCGRIVEEASCTVSDRLILWDILRHCPDSKVEPVLATVVQRKQWQAVSVFVNRNISHSQLQEVVETALQQVDCSAMPYSHSQAIKRFIMDLGYEKLDVIMAEFVRKGQWQHFCRVLRLAGLGDLVPRETFCDVCYKKVEADKTTLLHVLCASGFWKTFRLICREGMNQHYSDADPVLPETQERKCSKHADPLHPNIQGRSILSFATMCRRCPEKMVAECLKLGISTHQPELTQRAETKCTIPEIKWTQSTIFRRDVNAASPLECAIMKSSTMLMAALFESGASTYKEVHCLYLKSVVENPLDDGLTNTMREVKRCLEKLSSAPHSLKSSCRLVISHQLGVGAHREFNVTKLPLPENLKKYIQFSELVEQLFACGDSDSCKWDFDESHIYNALRRVEPTPWFRNITIGYH